MTPRILNFHFYNYLSSHVNGKVINTSNEQLFAIIRIFVSQLYAHGRDEDYQNRTFKYLSSKAQLAFVY